MESIYQDNGNLIFYLKEKEIEKLKKNIFITGYSKTCLGDETEIFYAVLKLDDKITDRNSKVEPEDWNFMKHKKVIISLNVKCLEEIVKTKRFQLFSEGKKITFGCYNEDPIWLCP